MNSNYSSLVKRGVELDYQIKQMTKELDDIKNSLKEAFAESGDKLFMSKDGEACATVTVKKRTYIDVADFKHIMTECGHAENIDKCLTVNRTKALNFLGKKDIEDCTITEDVATIAISFSAAK